MGSFAIRDLFKVKSGDFHVIEELDAGQVPLISCGDTNNGCVGFYDIPPALTQEHCLTVAYNGSWPIMAKFHPYRFAAKDDVAVLLPKVAVNDQVLLYVADQLNRMVWRYSYGRKCFRAKLECVRVHLPTIMDGDSKVIDQTALQEDFRADISALLPVPQAVSPGAIPPATWESFAVPDLLAFDRGDFHSIAALRPGDVLPVSRTSEDNGIVGRFAPPAGARKYPAGTITVSTVGGDAFLQLEEFIATDNVIVCTPKAEITSEGLLFLTFALNYQKWRYSYGRQCYVKKFSAIRVWLPVRVPGQVDWDYIAAVVRSVPYSHCLGRIME